MLQSTARTGDLRVVNVEDITAHYPPTLASWRENLLRNAPGLPERFDERFLRTWTVYLSLCEAGFTERRITDVQMVLAKPGFRDENLPAWPAPVSRDTGSPAPAVEPGVAEGAGAR
jgi:cyclopropane-fatty-acyl-phospholipid synthase